jgi:hypothetical protein
MANNAIVPKKHNAIASLADVLSEALGSSSARSMDMSAAV